MAKLAENISKYEFVRAMSYMKPRLWKYFTGMLVMSALFSILPVVESFTLKYVIEAAEQRKITSLNEGILYYSVTALLIVILIPAFRYLYNSCAHMTSADVKRHVFRHRGKLPISFYENRHSGDIISRMMNDTDLMCELYSSRLRRLIFPFIYGTAAAIPMFYLDWRVSTALMILNILSFYINFKYIKPIRTLSNDLQKTEAAMTEKLLDIFAGFNIMKIFHVKDIILDKYFSLLNKSTELEVEKLKKSSELDSINYLAGILSSLGVLAIGAFMVSKGLITFGTLFAIINLQGRLNSAFLQVSNYLPEVQGILAGASRVFEFLDEPQEPEKAGIDSEAAELNDAYISMKDIVFKYDDGKNVLDGFTLNIAEGKSTALVGLSGQGKSTVIKLLLGFYPPDSGGISIDGKSYGRYKLSELRNMIAYVPQDSYIFDGTIKENISYGRPDALLNEIKAAATAAYAHDFIMDQPDNYDTVVGERGIKLSGGQMQRIAIARALLKDAPVLLLDEATSSLDSESESQVQQALNVLTKNRTVLVIAHRLSTIEQADTICVIDEGKIIQRGRHEDLLVSGGLYKKLYETQFK